MLTLSLKITDQKTIDQILALVATKSTIEVVTAPVELPAAIEPAPAPVEGTKKKRGRPAKTETAPVEAAPVEAAPAPAEPVETTPVEAEPAEEFDLGVEPEAKPMTRRELVWAFQDFVKANPKTGKARAYEVLKSFGVKSVQDLKPEQYAEVAATLNS